MAPRALPDDVQQFWHHDIKVARDYNRSVSRDEARHFEKQLAQELAAAFSGDPEQADIPNSENEDVMAFRRRLSSLYHFSPDTLRRMSIGPRRLSQTTWSPSVSTLENRRRSSVKDLEKLYASLGGSEPPTRWSLGTAWKGGKIFWENVGSGFSTGKLDVEFETEEQIFCFFGGLRSDSKGTISRFREKEKN